MKNFKILFVLLMLSASIVVKAQQDPQYSLYMLNGMSIHPGYAGSLGGISANMLYRKQWLGIQEAPRTVAANVQMRYFDERLGSGISMYNDKMGVFNRSVVNYAQAYHLILPKFTVSFGLQGSLQQFSARLTDIYNAHNESGIMEISYDQAFINNVNKMVLNFGGGVYAYNDKFWFGASMPSMLKPKWDYDLRSGNTAYSITHSFVSAGAVVDAGPIFQIKPSMLLKVAQNSPKSLEFSCSAYANQKYGFGLSYRLNESLIFLSEIQLNENFKMAYAYDHQLSKFNVYNNGSHEIMIRYLINGSSANKGTSRLF